MGREGYALPLETLRVIWGPSQGQLVFPSQGTSLASPSDPRGNLVRENGTGTFLSAAHRQQLHSQAL